MRPALQIAALCGAWLVGLATAIHAQDAEVRAKDSRGLYSDDEQEILKYLENHTIPYIENTGAGNAPAADDPIFQDQVKRALEIFRTGSSELRLAIAKAFGPTRGVRVWPDAVGFWDACGPDDAEAQHYLFGIVLANAPAGMRKALRQWLLDKADLRYAPALLKDLCGGNLFAGTSTMEQDEILAFLRRLYTQQGRVVRYKGRDDETTISDSVQEYVVRLLPKTERGPEILLEWMTADGKTADEGALEAMWRQWQSMCDGDVSEAGEFCEATAKDIALAESWCLSPFKAPFPDKFRESKRLFEKNVWSQVFNEDERVRRSIITSLVSGGAYWHDRPSEFLKNLDVPVAARERAAAEAQEIYLRLKEQDEYTESEQATSWLEERFEALNAALLPE